MRYIVFISKVINILFNYNFPSTSFRTILIVYFSGREKQSIYENGEYLNGSGVVPEGGVHGISGL